MMKIFIPTHRRISKAADAKLRGNYWILIRCLMHRFCSSAVSLGVKDPSERRSTKNTDEFQAKILHNDMQENSDMNLVQF